MRSIKSRTFLYFRRDGRITKALHAQRWQGARSKPPADLFEKVAALIGTDLHEYEDAVQIICLALLDGNLSWRDLVKNKAAVIREVKRMMVYDGLTRDARLLSTDTESSSGINFGESIV